MSQATKPEWRSVRYAAGVYGVSPDTIRRMIDRGEIEAVRISARIIRVNVASISAATQPMGGAA